MPWLIGEVKQIHILLVKALPLRTLNYGNYGIFLIMGNAGFISSTVGMKMAGRGLDDYGAFGFSDGDVPAKWSCGHQV